MMPLTTEDNKTAVFLSNLFARLNEKKITYCVLRNYETLPERVGNDVDIWVKEEHRERLYSVIEELAYTLDYTLDYTPRLTLKGEGDYFLVKRNNPISVIHIDCWTYIHWKGIPYISQSLIENNLQWYKRGFYVLHPEIAAAIMLLKELLQHGKVKEKYKDAIKEIANNEGDLFVTSYRDFLGDKYSTVIKEMTKSGRWEDLEKKTLKLRMVLFVRSFMHPFSQLKWWLRYFHAQFRRFFVNPRGIFIVLIGPDGSGKSTTAHNLIDSEIKKLFQKRLYFHGHFPFLPELKKIVVFFKCKKIEVQKSENSSDFSSKQLGMLRSMIYPFYYGFNYFLGHFLIWKEKARGDLILFDRYFYDYMIQTLYAKCPRWLLYLIAKIIPKPDILIFLKNDPEVIYARKPELKISEIEKQLKICDYITSRFENGFAIKTSVTPDEIVEKIQKIIIKRIKDRKKIEL
jgi:thymidylate kinase